jgi:hypothetical protein
MHHKTCLQIQLQIKQEISLKLLVSFLLINSIHQIQAKLLLINQFLQIIPKLIINQMVRVL